MAVSASLLTAGGSAVSATSFNTASVSPTANDLILLWVVSSANLPTSVTGNGLTWVQITSQTTVDKSAVYRTMGAAPSAGAITIDFGANSQAEIDWVVVDYSGTNTSGTNGSGAIVQSAINSSATAVTSLTVTLPSAIGTGNAVAVAFGHGSTDAQTAGGSYTKLGENAAGGILGDFAHEWNATGTTTPSMSWSLSDVAHGIAVEIAIPPAGPTPTPPIVVATPKAQF